MASRSLVISFLSSVISRAVGCARSQHRGLIFLVLEIGRVRTQHRGLIFSSFGKDLCWSFKSPIPNYQLPIAPYQSSYFIMPERPLKFDRPNPPTIHSAVDSGGSVTPSNPFLRA